VYRARQSKVLHALAAKKARPRLMQPRPLVSPSRPRFEPNGRPWGMFAGLASFTAGAAGVISQSAEAMEFASPLSLYQRIPGKACISMTSIDDWGICRCGWPLKDFAAASCDSASTTE
jgi:hypothetical protein